MDVEERRGAGGAMGRGGRSWSLGAGVGQGALIGLARSCERERKRLRAPRQLHDRALPTAIETWTREGSKRQASCGGTGQHTRNRGLKSKSHAGNRRSAGGGLSP